MEINIHIEFEENTADLDGLAEQLQAKMKALPMVEDAEAIHEQMRSVSGPELVAIIGATILVIRSGRELSEELRKVVGEVQAWVAMYKEARRATIDIGDKRYSIDELMEIHFKRLEEVA